MIKDFLISFKDNITTKTTNPFFGTLIVVWLIKNWNLLYSVFNFDSDAKLPNKIDFIIKHFTSVPFYKTLGICVLDSFGIIIVSYILLNLTRLIINFFEKIVTPQVYSITDKSSIVLKTEYNILKEEKEKIENKLEEERQNRLRIQADYDKLETKLKEQLTSNDTIKDGDISLEKIISSVDENRVNRIVGRLQAENKITQLNKYISNSLNKIPMVKNEPHLSEFVSLGVFDISNHYGNDKYNYVLTDLGKKIRDRIFDL